LTTILARILLLTYAAVHGPTPLSAPYTRRRLGTAGGERDMEGDMNDLMADWRRWSRAERLSVWCVGVGLTGLVPALIFLG
jgi:hypothetical protein